MPANPLNMPLARFAIGEVVRHRLLDFRGVIFDVDPEFANSQEWYDAIPEAMRPPKDSRFTICSRRTPSRVTSPTSASKI